MTNLYSFHQNILLAFLVLAVTVFPQTVYSGEFAVSPMMIEIKAENRSSNEFSFSLHGKSSTVVKLELFDMTQLASGYMGFQKSNIENLESIASWVELEELRYNLAEGETTLVHGRLNVPAKAAGTHLLAIMVEEDIPEESKGGVSVKIRYAVVINLRIEGRYNRIQTEFDQLVVTEKDDGIYIEGSFINNSATEEWLFSQVQLRDQKNRLIERVSLKTQSAWQRNDAGSRVFPGAQVTVYGKISRSFSDGEYRALVRNVFADKSQAVFRDTVHLNTLPNESTGQQSIAGNNENVITINPESVEVSIRANGTSFSSFYINNNNSEVASISFPHSLKNSQLLGVSDFQFYPESVDIQPKQRSRVVLQQTHINNTAYGNITFTADLLIGQTTSTLSIPTIEEI